MQYEIAPLFCRPWTLYEITPRLIESHYEHNYGGAIRRLNAITKELESLDPKTTPTKATTGTMSLRIAPPLPAKSWVSSAHELVQGRSAKRWPHDRYV